MNVVSLNGIGTDSDGYITTYIWTRISGPIQYNIINISSAQTTINNLVEGVYQFQLEVTDNNGGVGRDSIVITVVAAPPPLNQQTVADAGTDITITLPINSAQLNGSASSDPDGTISSYSWTKVAGPTQFTISNSSIVNPSVTNLVAGTYTFRLTVTLIKTERSEKNSSLLKIKQVPINCIYQLMICRQVYMSSECKSETGTIQLRWSNYNNSDIF